MIGHLVRHHPLLDGMPKLMGMAFASASIAGNVLVFRVLRHGEDATQFEGSLVWFEVVLLLLAAGGLLLKGAEARSSTWYLGLPIPAQKLWRSHFLVVMACLMVLILLQWGVVVGFVFLMEALVERPIVAKSILLQSVIAPSLMGIFVAGALASYKPHLADLSQSAGYKRFKEILPLAAGALLVGLSFLPPVAGLVPVVGAMVLARRACRQLPATLAFGEGVTDGAGGKAGRSWDSLGTLTRPYSTRRWTVSLGFINQLFKIPYPYIVGLGIFVAFFTAMMAGLSAVGGDTTRDFVRLNHYGLAVYLLLAMAGEFTQRLHKVDAMPIDRRLLLAYLVVPMAVSVIVGYAGSRAWITYRDIPEERVYLQDEEGKYGVVVSPGFQQVDRDSTSREYLARQMSLAVREVYGVDIAPEELDERYLQLDEEGQAFVPHKGFTVAADYGLKPRSGGPVAPLILGPLFVAWFLIMGWFFRLHRQTRSTSRSKVIWGLFMAGTFGFHILLTFRVVPFWNEWEAAVRVFSSARQLGEMGHLGSLLAYGTALLLSLAAWRFCCRMFLRMEAPRG